MKNIFLVTLVLFLFTACSYKDPNIKSVQTVDLNRYIGSWYEIARYEHKFEKDCKNVTATYSIKENDKIEVINRCTKITTGEKTEAIGEAYAVDNTNAKLKVSFFWPFYGDYWIIMLDKNYSYAVISEPSKKYLWILSRDKKLDEKIKEKILKRLESLDYDLSKLIWTVQD
ncbi:lipocalin family protein [Halarcobacter sp.]|uniref:lipocalin family protein n=1 Tax=Halarcobacter sp. TaxID=2321133 RepID=UPI003A9527C2